MKLLITFFLLISSVSAHPHTFIDVYPTLLVKNSKLSKVHFRWVLDEMTSAILIMELDRNGDGKIDAKENKFIEDNYFSMFKDYSYYTFIYIDKKIIKTPPPKNFKATIKNNRISYSFDIVYEFDIANTYFDFGDSSYYVAMVLKDEFLSVDGALATLTREDNSDYYGFRLVLK